MDCASPSAKCWMTHMNKSNSLAHVLACALLAAWALAAYLACLALSRRVFVLMLALCTLLLICIA